MWSALASDVVVSCKSSSLGCPDAGIVHGSWQVLAGTQPPVILSSCGCDEATGDSHKSAFLGFSMFYTALISAADHQPRQSACEDDKKPIKV